MKKCIVILGVHRSGTSVLAGLVSIVGAYTGEDLMLPTEDNPKGYFENNAIVSLNEKILKEFGSAWNDPVFTLENVSKSKLREFIDKAKTIISKEIKYIKKLVIKDPRLCILFPIWEKALKELNITIKVLLIYRNPLEVAHSLKVRKRDGLLFEHGLLLWAHLFLQAEFLSRKYKPLIIEYNKDFCDLKKFITLLHGFINNDSSVPDRSIIKNAKEFYSPKLKHHTISFENISDDLPAYFKKLVDIVANKQISNKRRLNEIRKEHLKVVQLCLHDWSLNKETREQKIILENLLKQEQVLSKNKHKENYQLKQSLELKQKKQEKMKQKLEASTQKLEASKQKLEASKQKLEASKQKLEASTQEKIKLINTKKLLEQKLNKKEKTKEQTESIVNLFFDRYYSKKLLKSKSYLQRVFRNKEQKQVLRDYELINQSGFFSPLFYLSNNPDVAKAGMDPLLHYCKFGWKEGRIPSLSFDATAYLLNNPDVRRARVNPLFHYIKSGKKEGRRIDSVVLSSKNQVPVTQRNAVPAATRENDKPYLSFGPSYNSRWKTSLTAIKILSQKKRLTNKKIPRQLIEFSKKQLQSFPLKISVIMPTWNRQNSISLAIDSILSQSYLPFEIIISDDGSTDKSIALIKHQYAKQISEGLIKILENHHQGVSATRNMGLMHAKGDLIAYLDSDNLWREHYLLIMAAAFSENDELNCAYSALERHDKNKNIKNKLLATHYDRKKLLEANFIDLNVFIHRRILYQQFGGFDTQLKRLVDWELIIHYTKYYIPAFIPFVGVDYFLDDKNLKNITTRVSLDDNRQRVYQRHTKERIRYGLEELRLAYVLWDFPALSQTFVMEELKWLVHQGYDVIVYYAINPDKSATLDFKINSFMVNNESQLASLLEQHQRNFCHAHFAYPTVTKLAYPACTKANIPFTFMAHAVDIFHHKNKKRNKIGEISQHPLCQKVMVHGEFHKKFLKDCGVPGDKIGFNIQAVNVTDFAYNLHTVQKIENKRLRGVVITRFVEKKGLSTLIEAASLLKGENVEFNIYGYGPLEEEYKNQIDKLGLNNIFLKGVLTNKQAVVNAYQRSDFFILPCVVAKNGDTDGFPTVILEAMAMGLPVITTDVAAIPDYLSDGIEALVAPAADVDQLASRVRKLITLSPQRKAAMIKRSQDFLDKKIGVRKTMQMLLDTWQTYTLDIFLVTYNTERHENRRETFEIIERIYKYTTTPFTLTIVDNDSDEDFWSELCERVIDKTNVRLIRKRQNIFCGPASNIALELSDSEFAIYICSKEGFIKKHGWERVLLAHMRENPNDAIAGHHSQMPQYIYGREYETHPEFSKFRNMDFALDNPDRIFKHIQGGIYIIRRDFIKKYGGFNPATPHGAMDIEMSYYIESLGYGLGEIPEVASITVKTRPDLSVILNERTVVAHPLSVETVVNKLDSLDKKLGQFCNICGWRGTVFVKNEITEKCPKCHSTGFSRSILKILANDHHIYRKEICGILSADASLNDTLKKMFKLVCFSENAHDFVSVLNENKSRIDCIIVDPDLMVNDEAIIWQKMVEKLSSRGEIIFADSKFEDNDEVINVSKCSNKNIKQAFVAKESEYSIKYQDFSSYCIGYDWRRFGRVFPKNN